MKQRRITAAEADARLARVIAAASKGSIDADEALRRLRNGDITTAMLDALVQGAGMTNIGLGRAHARRFVRKVLGKPHVLFIDEETFPEASPRFYVEYEDGGEIVFGPLDSPHDLIREVLRWKATVSK